MYSLLKELDPAIAAGGQPRNSQAIFMHAAFALRLNEAVLALGLDAHDTSTSRVHQPHSAS